MCGPKLDLLLYLALFAHKIRKEAHMPYNETVTSAEEYVVLPTNRMLDYLTALAIVDESTLADQFRAGIDDFTRNPEDAVAELIILDITEIPGNETRRPARLLLPSETLDSIEYISAESHVVQSDLIDVALQNYIGRRLADPQLLQKIAGRTRRT